VDEDFARTPAFGKLLADGAKPKVAFNSVGGPSASIVAKALAPGGKLVTFGSSSRKGVHLASSHFLSNGISAEGFNLQTHLAGLSKESRDKLVQKAVADVSGEKPAVKQLVAREPFANFTSAIARSLAAGERKVVLVMPTQ
jgi:NADPH:quinone reductase-like Zn-dependent oxidoreductase